MKKILGLLALGVCLHAQSIVRGGSGSALPTCNGAVRDHHFVLINTGSPDQEFICLAGNGGTFAWMPVPTSVGFTNPMTTAGDLIVGGSSGQAQVLHNTASQGWVLTSQGPGTVPVYAALPGISYPAAGVVVSTGSGYGTSLTAPTSGTLVGLTDTQSLTNKTLDGIGPAIMAYLANITGDVQTQLNGKQASGSYITGNQTITLSGDVSGSGTTAIAATVGQVNGGAIPASAAVVGTNASKQFQAVTTQGTGNKVQMSSGTVTQGHCASFDSTGSTMDSGTPCAPSVGQPYLVWNGVSFIPADNLSVATKPSLGSWTALGSQAATRTAQTNGDWVIDDSGTTTQAFIADPSHTASIEAVLSVLPTTQSAGVGIWVQDSTNNKVHEYGFFTSGNTTPQLQACYRYDTFTGSGNPTDAGGTCWSWANGLVHAKATVSGSTVTFAVSQNGGANWKTVQTVTGVGTVPKIGLFVQGGIAEAYSVVTQ